LSETTHTFIRDLKAPREKNAAGRRPVRWNFILS
jgi:hypothetical protein